MHQDKKQNLFAHYRESQEIAGITTVRNDSLICPLCWNETSLDELTLEHFIPESIGGKRTILTCAPCNNNFGSELDSHIAQYQKAVDFLKGSGTLPTALTVNGKTVQTRLSWGKDTKNLQIIGKASNPSATNGIEAELRAGLVDSLHCKIRFGYSEEALYRGLLRAAYLSLFKCYGYEYLRQNAAQRVRTRIYDATVDEPRIKSLVVQLTSTAWPFDDPYVILPLHANDVSFFITVIRLRSRESQSAPTYMGVFNPGINCNPNDFFSLMEQCSKPGSTKVTIDPKNAFT